MILHISHPTTNSCLHLCEESKTKEEMVDKTLSTFSTASALLALLYRTMKFKTYINYLRLTKPNRPKKPMQWRHQQGGSWEARSLMNKSIIKLLIVGQKVSLLSLTLPLSVSSFLANVSSVVETVTWRRIAEQASAKRMVVRDI